MSHARRNSCPHALQGALCSNARASEEDAGCCDPRVRARAESALSRAPGTLPALPGHVRSHTCASLRVVSWFRVTSILSG